MKVIGLCGGSGSGKGTVSSIFWENKIPAVDTDAVYREMTQTDSPCLRALALEFADVIISEDGSLNRKALAELVFSGEGNEKRLKRLNEITHKYILDETRARLEQFRAEGFLAAIVDAPVLFESGFDEECDLIVCVIADRDIRLSRIIERDNIDVAAATRRIDSQISNEELISRSDFVIYNNSDLNTLKYDVFSVAKQIIEK